MSFAQAFDLTISPAVEGGFQISRQDKGNWTKGVVGEGLLMGTNMGVSAYFLWGLPTDDPHYQRNPRLLTASDVEVIYRTWFWDAVRADDLTPPVAGLLFDAAVNQGQGWAPECLQLALGVSADGDLGAKTMAAVAKADPLLLHAEIGRLRCARYYSDPDFHTYGGGWVRRLMSVVASTAAFT